MTQQTKSILDYQPHLEPRSKLLPPSRALMSETISRAYPISSSWSAPKQLEKLLEQLGTMELRPGPTR